MQHILKLSSSLMYGALREIIMPLPRKFPDKGLTINGLNYLLKKLRDTGTTARQP